MRVTLTGTANMDRQAMAQTLESMTDREILSALYLDMHDVKQDIEIIKSDNAKLKKTVFGNGEVGLTEKHNSLQKEFSNLVNVLKWIAITFGVLLSGLLFSIFTGQVKVVFP